MYCKKEIIGYFIGIFLFLFVVSVGFFKMNIVYSSSGVGTSSDKIGNSNFVEENQQTLEVFSSMEDNAFIKTYKQDYGYDVVLKVGDNEKVLSLRLPWEN